MSQEDFELNGGYILSGEVKLEDHHIGPDVTREELIRRLLMLIEPVNAIEMREGLVETPARVAKAYDTWFGGYNEDPAEVLKVFKDGADSCDTMVVVKNIEFWSHCEHHMAPFFGTVTVAYIPDETNKKIVGLSKITRLVNVFARRLQVQERLTNQIADSLEKELGALGVGVYINARHSCVESRGVKSSGQSTVTTALRGVIRSDRDARSEFLTYIK